MMTMRIASIGAALLVAAAFSPAAADLPLPQVGHFSESDVVLTHARYPAVPWTVGMDCGRDDQVAAEQAQLARARALRAANPFAAQSNANGDNDATHYARGATYIIHVFINHSGGTWDLSERSAAGVKAFDAKNFYLNHQPFGANIVFDHEGGSGYTYYTATVGYNIPTDGMTWAITEDALASLGFTDSDGDGARVDDATYALQDYFDYDNVMFVFEPADRTGRAFASYGYARTVNYTDDPHTTWRHEWGHVFGACDEYVEDGHCNGTVDCGACQSTYLGSVVNNGNCDLASCPSDVSCVMRNNVDAICGYTEDFWSWNDDSGNGVLDYVYRRLVGGAGFTPIYETRSGGSWTWSSTTGGFGYHQFTDTWAVVGMRPPSGTDYDITLFNDNNHDHALATSAQASSNVDFIVTDYNHSQRGIEHQQMYLYSGPGGDYRIQYESGTATLYPDGVNRAGSWGTSDVVRIWEVPLFGGETVTFVLDVTSGSPDLSMALYGSNGAAYSAGRSSYAIQANSAGAGGTESFTFDVPSDDVYGLVVWSNTDGVSGNFAIQIGPTPLTLAEEVPYYSAYDLRLYNYDPNASYWAFVGTRPDAGVDVDLGLFSTSSYTTQLAEATAYGAGAMEWFMVDYNHVSTAPDYLRVNRVVDPGNHRTMWEQDAEVAPQVGASVPFTSPTLGKVWDVYMSAGQTYYFRSYQSPSTFDNGLYLYRSTSGNYYQPREDFVAFSNQVPANQLEDITYTAPASDWYGLLVPVFSASTGNASVWWGPSEVLAEDATLSQYDDVMFGDANVTSGYWSVFAVRAPDGHSPSINLYDDNNYSSPWLATDQLGPGELRYVVGDFNHSATGHYYPLVWEDNGSQLTTEWEGGTELLAFTVGGHNWYQRSWPAGDVAEMFDLYIPAGRHVGVLVEDLSGNMDLGIELFDSNAAAYFASRGGGVASGDAFGVGGTESLHWLNPGSSDYAGLVVYNRSTAGGSYRIHIVDAASVDVASDVPKVLQFAAAPNPWTARTTLRLTMPVEGDAMIDIMDLQGRLVRQVHRGTLQPGVHEIRWDGRDTAGNSMPPGIYLARLRTAGEQRLLKLVRAD